MENEHKPCCAADALRRIRQIPINGIMTGNTMLDESIAWVKAQGLTNEPAIREALVQWVNVYNYIPLSVRNQYADSLMEEYRKSSQK